MIDRIARYVVGAVIAASIWLAAGLLDAPAANAAQNFDNGRVADAAIAEVGSVRATGWNMSGECIKSAQRWVGAAGGYFGGGGVISGYVASGASSVSLGSAVKGDVIQYTSNNLVYANNDWTYAHTVVVVANHGNGYFDIVQSNVPLGSGRVTRATNWRPSPAAGWVARAWRFGKVIAGSVANWREWQQFSTQTFTSAPAVTTWGRGRLDVFVRDDNLQLAHRWFVGGVWSDWESLGAPAGTILASAPSAVAWMSGRIDIFAKGVDASLWHKWYDNGRWYDWEWLGGLITSAPSVASWAPGRLDVFARGLNGDLVHKWFSGGWSGWESLGGYLTTDPAAVSWGPGRIDIFVGSVDFSRPGISTMYHKWYDGGRWYDWECLGGSLTSAPAVSSWAPGRLDVFARGINNDLIHLWYADRWYNWESLGGGLTSAPGTVSWSVGAIDVLVLGTDQRLWQKYHDI